MFPQLLAILKENKLFNKVKDSELNFHISLENLIEKKHGDIIYREGDAGHSVYVVISGLVEIEKSHISGTPAKVIVPKDDFFGEEDYLEYMPRTSTARAVEDSNLVKLDAELLVTLCNVEQFMINIRRQSGTAVSAFADPAESDINDDFEPEDISGYDFKKVPDKPEDIPYIQEAPVSETASPADSDEITAGQLKLIMQAAQLVNSNIRIDDLLQIIVDASRSLASAERGTLYLVDKEKNELWSKIIDGKGISEIRLRMGEGIAGQAAKNREIINIKDVSQDPRFKSRIDHSSGFVTKNMLCFPIVNKTDEVIGLLQLLNSTRGEFTKRDEEFLSMLSVNAAMALENAELVERLLQTERVTSLGKMANFLIQDIKKPVLVSKRYAEHLKTKELTPDVMQVVNMLLEQLNHVADLVQTTSSYSDGRVVLHSVVCRMNETLVSVFDKLVPAIKIRNCDIIKQYDKEATVKLDRKEFYQCCMHIIRNACDAMPDGGKIFVTTKNKKTSVEVSFKDNGPGIPDSIKDKIFDPFMSHGKTNGTGLGLSITKKIIEDHGGTITVESDLGEGTTFTISIPVAVGK
ncbi:MAG: ATP-binding protein [Ignavibacteria bacterium]